MKKFRSKTSAAALTVVLALMATAIGLSAVASAAGATDAGSGSRPSAWAEVSDFATSDEAPSITNDVGAPESGAGAQLPLGLGLLGLGLTGVVGSLVVAVGKPRVLARGSSPRRSLAGAEHPPIEARVSL